MDTRGTGYVSGVNAEDTFTRRESGSRRRETTAQDTSQREWLHVAERRSVRETADKVTGCCECVTGR